jgi:hypothetical protein
MNVFCFYLMMEIVVESSSITEIPSVLPYSSTRNKKKNRTTYNIFGQSNSNWNTYPTLEN